MSGTATTVDDPLLTTGQAALLLGASRQHVVDLCDQGRLPFESIGRHRRVRHSDITALKRHPDTSGLTRDQFRSLWLHRAVVGKVVANPERAVDVARRNLRRLQQQHPRGRAHTVLAEWARLLDGPIEPVLDVLTSRSQRGIELRQSSPFAGLLTERERSAVLGASASAWARR
jgi:excisionase family DNA binding protein